MSFKKNLIISSLALLSCLSAAALAMSSYTVAAFSDTKQVEQQAGYSGTLKTSIFLNANVWEVDNPVYYLYAFKNAGGVDPEWIHSSKTINPTINDVIFTMYVFEFDAIKYDRIVFARMNPNGANVPSFTTNDDPKTLWNQTENITYSSSINYYCITGWSTSSYETNHLAVNGSGNLYFD